MDPESSPIVPDGQLRLNIEPLEFSVDLRKTWQAGGLHATLRIDSEGITVSQIRFQPGKTLAQSWGRIRSLRTTNLLDKRAFEVDLGHAREVAVCPMVVRDGPFDQLVAILNALPETARDKKCIACGGPVRDGTCLGCGANLAAKLRSKGLRTMLIGVATAALGTVVTLASYQSARSGGTFLIFTGLIVFGVVYFIVGLINAIAGKNIQ